METPQTANRLSNCCKMKMQGPCKMKMWGPSSKIIKNFKITQQHYTKRGALESSPGCKPPSAHSHSPGVSMGLLCQRAPQTSWNYYCSWNTPFYLSTANALTITRSIGFGQIETGFSSELNQAKINSN